MHNLRSLVVKSEDLGRDPVKDKMRFGFRKARKLVISVLRDSFIEIAGNEREMESCLDSEQFIKYLNDKKQITDDLKQKVEVLFDDMAQYEVVGNIVPQVIQLVKDVFKHNKEEKPSLNGMHGLQADELKGARRSVQELLVQGKSQRLMSEIIKILQKLCRANELQLCSAKGVTLNDFERWGRRLNIESLLTALDPFFKEPTGFKIRKRSILHQSCFREL